MCVGAGEPFSDASFGADSRAAETLVAERALVAARRVAERWRGPGGAVAVVHRGRVVAQEVWGFSDGARRVPMTERTIVPWCSLTKSFVAGTLLAAVGAPEHLDPLLLDVWPHVFRCGVRTRHLCHNQSGLRDYWALSVLEGAAPGDAFSLEDARRMLRATRSTQFAPGSAYAYSNSNFHLLARLLERAADAPIADLVARLCFAPAGVTGAVWCPDTDALPGGCVGHEGTAATGYTPVRNRICWSGDAGVSGSLRDLIAWEAWLDAMRDDPGHWTGRQRARPAFDDGTVASYGYGLAHATVHGVPVVGHTGALPGFRLERWHAPAARVSVVAFFNHNAPWGAADLVLEQVLRPRSERRRAAPRAVRVGARWSGAWLDRGTGLVVRTAPHGSGTVRALFAGEPEVLTLTDSGSASGDEMTVRLETDGALHGTRDGENLSLEGTPLRGVARADIVGHYLSATTEIVSSFRCATGGAHLYGAFDGPLGAGPLQELRPVGPDVWVLDCPRSLDAPPPGDWTVLVHRDAAGNVSGLTVGCWLARGVRYERVNDPDDDHRSGPTFVGAPRSAFEGVSV